MHVFETPGDVSLHVRLPSGSVVVTTADTPQTTVEILARGRRGQDAVDEIDVTLEERRGGHVVKIEQKDRFRWGPIQITWGGDFECRITCPPGSGLDLSGGSTDLRADGDLGEVSARTASGDVRLSTVRGALEVKTASGDVRVQSVSGDVRIGVGRGTRVWIDATSVSGTLDSELGLEDGAQDAESAESGVVPIQVKTVSGDVSIVRATTAAPV